MMISSCSCILWALAAATATAAIEVSQAPKLVHLVDKLNQPEATNATIMCSIGSGDPTSLTYRWFKDDVPLRAGNKFKIHEPAENFQSILRIISLDPEDAGLYTCEANNNFGQDKITIKLNVKVQLKWLQEPPAELQVPVGRFVQVSCRSSGQPEPKLEWRKLAADGQARGEVLGSELQFASVSQQDAGVYECRASNGVEKDLVAVEPDDDQSMSLIGCKGLTTA